MKNSALIPVYTLTLILSAVLLFSVQPLLSRMILPLLGGTPQVWNTAMLFFQALLLAGYAYAHLSSKFLSPRIQACVQVVLLFSCVVFLPIVIPPEWLPPVDRDPTLWQLTLMTVLVGGPFFVLSASAPLLQHWFSRSGHGDAQNPYFLYGASNLGSMSALLAYPFLIEPLASLDQQSHLWMIGYFILIGMTILAGSFIWHTRPYDLQSTKVHTTKIDWKRRATWLVLAFVPSSLMLGVTTFITTDIASAPLLWILPLSLYVATFILAFARRPLISRKHIMLIHGLLIIALIPQLMVLTLPVGFLILFHMALFFFAALACHTELAALRPSTDHLTEFYLIMSVGGVLGGFFNAIVAPNLFIIPIEYGLALAGSCFLRYVADRPFEKITFKKFTFENVCIVAVVTLAAASQLTPSVHLTYIFAFLLIISLSAILEKRTAFAVAVVGALLIYPPGYNWGVTFTKKIVLQDRNFFAVMRVVDKENGERIFLHGTTMHGAQALAPELQHTPLSYYSATTPMKNVFDIYNESKAPQNIAVIGLGVGASACYAQPGRMFDFFEIDPDVVKIAENSAYFTYLSGCGSPYQIILGDGRLTMRKQADHHYDLIVIDAFSSDNIPVHLITLEAIELYRSKLKPGGMLLFHISNRYLDLEPVLEKASRELGMFAYGRLSAPSILMNTQIELQAAHYVVLVDSEVDVSPLLLHGWSEAHERKNIKAWTDQYSNIVSTFGNRTRDDREREMQK